MRIGQLIASERILLTLAALPAWQPAAALTGSIPLPADEVTAALAALVGSGKVEARQRRHLRGGTAETLYRLSRRT